jgi:hypothetical protein
VGRSDGELCVWEGKTEGEGWVRVSV